MIPARTRVAVKHHFGDKGDAWLADFPGLLDQLVVRWQLTLGEPFSEGWDTNIVYPASRQERAYVLKTGYPQPELNTELEVLKQWRGAPRRAQLVDYDATLPAILLERVLPGSSLKQTGADIRQAGVPEMIRTMPLAVEKQQPFPTYQQWIERAFQTFQAAPDDMLATHVQRVNSLAAEYIGAKASHLLHGDLHHENMLLGSDGHYVAIDPKGVLGPPVMEYGRFMHNCIEQPSDMHQILEQRAKAFSGVFTPGEILQAGYIDCVLALTWSVNDGLGYEPHYEKLLGAFRDLLQRFSD